MELSLNIFTLNCWGIPFVSKNRKDRIQAIADYLQSSSHNIVCLQEVWSELDYMFFKENIKNVLPYSHYFYSGVLGSGLCVFSKWSIQDVFFHQWPLNGYIHKIHHGDWFGGKGVGLCRIKCGNRLINIYCTHFHAEYHENDMYLAHRVLQAYTTAEFVNLTTAPADISILAGDLNTGPGDLSYRLITSLTSLLDPYDIKCAATNPEIIKETGTCDVSNNSYSNSKEVKKSPEGKRLDHILFHMNSDLQPEILNFGNPLKDRVPGQKFSYSDHNAVCLELNLKTTLEVPEKRFIANYSDGLERNIFEAIKVIKEAQTTIIRSKKLFLLSGGILFMLLLGTVGMWPHSALHDVTRIILTVFSLYYIIMGTLWNRIEMNSLKAGLNGLENLYQSICEKKPYVVENHEKLQ